jgi:hypothetical protein
MLHPSVFGILIVPDLIHHREGVSAIGIDRVIETDRGANRIQSLGNILNGNAQLLGNFLKGRFPAHLSGSGFLALQHPVGDITNGTGDPYGAVVPQIPSDFSRDHRNDCLV